MKHTTPLKERGTTGLIQYVVEGNDRMRMAEARKNLIAQYADMVAEDPHPCCHGHVNCAIRPGGPCSDEMLTKATPSSEAA